MEPSVLFLVLVSCLPTGLFAWSFGASGNPRANAVLAMVSLYLTVLGLALVVYVFAFVRLHPPTHGAGGTFAGAIILFELAPGVILAWFGTCLSLAVCLIGLRRSARREVAWFATLLIGALVPVIAWLAMLLVSPTLDAVARENGSLADALSSVRLMAPFVVPALTGVVTTAYAFAAARRRRAGAGVPA